MWTLTVTRGRRDATDIWKITLKRTKQALIIVKVRKVNKTDFGGDDFAHQLPRGSGGTEKFLKMRLLLDLNERIKIDLTTGARNHLARINTYS